MLDYDDCFAQRQSLDLLRQHSPKLGIPECSLKVPCLDGRCSVCGARVMECLEEFALEHWSNGADVRTGAYTFGYSTIAAGSTEKVDFTKAIRAVTRIAAHLALQEASHRKQLVFMATIGLVDGTLSEEKFIAFEMYYKNAAKPFDGTAEIESVARERLSLMPYNGGPTILDNGSQCPFREALLFNYIERAVAWPDDVRIVTSTGHIREMSKNFGKHSILDRVITHGIRTEKNTLVLSPGTFDGVVMTGFPDDWG